MPIHDWTRVDAGTFHDFHQGWTIELRNRLNGGILSGDYIGMTEPPIRQAARVETEAALYALKANRIAIRHGLGRVVAMIEIVSPGNKNSRHAIASFVAKAVEFLRNGIHFLVVDLFPPGPRDPDGIAQAIWDQVVGEPMAIRTGNDQAGVAAFDAGEPLTAYVDPIAIGDPLPDAPLFLGPGWYVNVPLEASYQAAWDVTPRPIRALIETPGTP